MKRLLLALGLVLFSLACVPGPKATPSGDPSGSPAVSVDGLATEVISAEPLGPATPLDPDAEAAETVAENPGQDEARDLNAPGPELRPELRPEPRPEDLAVAPEPGLAASPELETAPDAETLAAPEPKPPSSPEEAACLRKGGLWTRAGKSIAMTCIKITRDAGKQCSREQDCQGQCLARSRTCAPYDPLFGCNEVLQNDGSRVTLCID